MSIHIQYFISNMLSAIFHPASPTPNPIHPKARNIPHPTPKNNTPATLFYQKINPCQPSFKRRRPRRQKDSWSSSTETNGKFDPWDLRALQRHVWISKTPSTNHPRLQYRSNSSNTANTPWRLNHSCLEDAGPQRKASSSKNLSTKLSMYYIRIATVAIIHCNQCMHAENHVVVT